MRRPSSSSELAHYFETSPIGIEIVEDGLKELPFGEYLVERGLLTRMQLYQALTTQDRNPGVPFGEVVAAMGFVSPEVVDDALAEYNSLPAVEV